MVLENAASAEEPSASSFSDSIPSSDNDPYASDSSSSAYSSGPRVYIKVDQPGPGENQQLPSVHVNLANLPRRFSLIGEVPHPQVLTQGIIESCRIAHQVLHRPVTQEEADAFAYHFAKSLRVGSYGTPAGVFLGTLFWYRGRETLRFPGYNMFTEKGILKPDNFFGLLRGRNARMLWQGLRLTAYWGVAGFFGQIFFGSYAVSTSLAGRAMDPRLKEFNEKLKQRMKDGQGVPSAGKIDAAQESRMQGTTQNETYEQMRQRRTVQDRLRKGKEQKQDQYDDVSPTGGAFDQDYSGGVPDTGMLSDDQIRQQDSRQRAEDRRTPMNTTAGTFDMQEPSSTQPQQRSMAPSASEPSSRTSGSSWERLRQKAASEAPASPRPPQQNQQQFEQSRGWPSGGARNNAQRNSDGGDSFSFSNSEEDKALAKSEAQRDFDRRIEKEREGKDFDTSDRGTRW